MRLAGSSPVQVFARATIVALLVALMGVTPAAASEPPVPTAFQLTPEDARTDRERLWALGCVAAEVRTVPRTHCVFGNKKGGFTLALVGDSHLSHLFPAFEKVAQKRGWRLVTYLKVSCPFLDIPVRNILQDREYTECATWNTTVLKRLKKLKPDLTVTLAFRWIRPIDTSQDTPTKEGRAVGRMLKQVPGKRAVIVDTPFSLRSIPDCLTQHPKKPAKCRIPKVEVLTSGVRTRERTIAKVGRATYIDMTKRICGGFPCRVVTPGGVVMFRDSHHLTATYAATLTPAIRKQMDRARS